MQFFCKTTCKPKVNLFGDIAVEEYVGTKVPSSETKNFTRESSYCFSASYSHRNFVCPFVLPSVTRVDQSKTVQARMTKFSPSAAWKTLVLGTVNRFHKFEGGHPK